MNVALVDVDGHNFPNLALMKLSAWHKVQGDYVEWYSPLFSNPDRIYASKVFTFSTDYIDYAPGHPEPVKGGTGYDFSVKLPEDVESTLPDYSIYPQFKEAYGFLTRGCIRNCPWCVVPRKEGGIKTVDDVERIAQGRKHLVLMDNNFLAAPAEFVAEQLGKAKQLGLYLDFNQALDARLVNEDNARLLAAAKWTRYIRFSCDTHGMLSHTRQAVSLLRNAGYKKEFFVYCLALDVKESLERIRELMSIDRRIVPFCMPYRNLDGDGQVADPELKRLANWCNRAWIRKSCDYKDFRG